MTRDEGLLISLQKEPHKWVAYVDSTYIAPNGDKYLKFFHKPTKTILNIMEEKDEDFINISFSRPPKMSRQEEHSTFGRDDMIVMKDSEIVRSLNLVYEISELDSVDDISFHFLSHVERL